MESQIFEKLVSEITGENISLWLSDTPNEKYRSYKKFTGIIQPETKYGIIFNYSKTSFIEFDFKTTKNPETFIKSFINNYVARKVKTNNDYGFFEKTTKEKEFERLAKNCNERVTHAGFYTTLYGIGCFALFYSQKTLEKLTQPLRYYLDSKNISYTNEYSEAGWVYRFVINKDVKIHNDLLTNFN
jgi:hypothetical protein